ncbi:MAG: penicillin-binding protein [bacterium]|nr:penicillin-binding protein [bacterium]
MLKINIRRIIIGSVIALFLFTAWTVYLITQLPGLPENLSDFDLSLNTVIYSNDGRVIEEIGERTYIPLQQISPYFVDAVLAIEDKRFYEHSGIDKISLIKSIIDNVLHMGYVRGFSTITQQLAKNMFLTFRKTLLRKYQEILLAVQFEIRYSKNDILEAYCNQINYGGGALGVENASLMYFGKHASELDIAEATLLAAVPHSPTSLYENLDRPQRRQKLILNAMLAQDMITKEEYDSVQEYQYRFRNLLDRNNVASHFINLVKRKVSEEFGSDLVNYGGLRIYTTIDLDMQEKAVEAVEEGMMQLDTRLGKGDYRLADNEARKDFPQTALVSVDPRTGEVKAMIGGRDTRGDFWNRAVRSRRSPGSSFKPILYFTAFNDGAYSGNTVMVDSQVTYSTPAGDWTPDNFDDEFQGPVIMKYGFIRSINTIAAQLIHDLTPEKVVENAGTLGLETDLMPVLALSLGSEGASVQDMTAPHSTIINGGIRNKPYFIKRIEDADGNILLDDYLHQPERIVDPTTAYQVVDLLQGTLGERGTGAAVKRLGFRLPAGAKTGTTNDFRDAWFAGGTPDNVTVVWVGYDSFVPMIDSNRRGITGGSGALPIWTYYMKKIEERLSGMEFEVPNTIEFRYYNIHSGELTDDSDPDGIRVAVRR